MNPVYYLSETFESIQGEGDFAGVRSFFVRFHFCNLRCLWCDTKYTWVATNGIQQTSADELIAQIKASPAKHIILTGGEPAMYRLDKLAVVGKKMHVETNGTILPTKPFEMALPNGKKILREAMERAVIEQFHWVVSPKMANAGELLDEQALLYWKTMDDCIFKFIIQTKSDIDAVDNLVQKWALPKEKVYLALEGNTVESQLNGKLVDEIITQGYHFSPRLQVMLWGDKRMK